MNKQQFRIVSSFLPQLISHTSFTSVTIWANAGSPTSLLDAKALAIASQQLYLASIPEKQQQESRECSKISQENVFLK